MVQVAVQEDGGVLRRNQFGVEPFGLGQQGFGEGAGTAVVLTPHPLQSLLPNLRLWERHCSPAREPTGGALPRQRFRGPVIVTRLVDGGKHRSRKQPFQQENAVRQVRIQ